MVLGKIKELPVNAQIITKVKVVDIRERESEDGSIFYIGTIVDKDGVANFITNIPLEKGKCYEIFGRVTDEKSVKIIEKVIKGIKYPREIPEIPKEELFNRGEVFDVKVPAILEISSDNIYINYYCSICNSLVEAKIKPKGLVYICKNCGELDPEEVIVRIKALGKIHFGTVSKRCYIPFSTLEKYMPRILEILEEFGVEDTIKDIAIKLHGKTFLVRGFDGKDGNYIITELEDI
ncbi:hypothetical protein J422_00831 [Methanocaldococcus villosus KIN24-T80]|uniref:Uncharacterized protein n=1 Tax=Methanocaldococcus villosus KIN24-T80 TaxID=1069083 RepID=N6VU63_9EURY|nr:hypothetical protein [Methanocaldococcus villosus]ENN96736.1 hypothetical protein J422_00831 [Methanocaldococcus villosus KIN24-T80]